MKKLVVSPSQGGEPGDRDQQVDVDRALAGDGAAEQHHRLAGDDEADEGAGLGEGEDADQQVGPGAERVGDVLQQPLQVEAAELAADEVIARRDDRDGDHDQQVFAALPTLSISRQLHGALPASQTIASSRSIAAAAARAAPRSGKSPTAVGPEPLSSAAGAPASRSASRASPIRGRSERAAGSRSLTSSSEKDERRGAGAGSAAQLAGELLELLGLAPEAEPVRRGEDVGGAEAAAVGQ